MRSRRRLLILATALLAFLIVSALLYHAGMEIFEHKDRSLLDSFEWATETLTTTGYGHDSHWTHPAMVALVVVAQLAGLFMIPLITVGFILPYLTERFEQRAPREADAKLAHHVIVYRFGPAVETLVQRLSESRVPLLVVDTDEAAARAVMDRGLPVVFSRTEEDMLDVCRAGAARAIVANGRDEENAALILRARQSGFAGEVYTFVEDPAHRKAMELAGATAAYTPRHIVAAALAAHASDVLSPRVPGIEAIGGIERRELRVPTSSPIAGRTLGESRIAESGAVVVGVWSRSRLLSHCNAETRIDAGCVLELAGEPEALQRAAQHIGAPLLRNSGPFLVAGFGEVGRKVHELLTDVGEEVRVVDRNPSPGIVVGDVLDASVLERAGLLTSRAIILALDSDDATLFATVIVRDAVPDVTVIARVNHARNVENIHRAGADYALSIAEVSGEMLSARLLRKATRVRDEHRRAYEVGGAPYAGRSAAEVGSVLAIRRGAELIRTITPDVRIEAGDSLWMCGAAP
jgi:Trk K+ transport system NAD-binding subunit